jgi:hypothetical protein
MNRGSLGRELAAGSVARATVEVAFATVVGAALVSALQRQPRVAGAALLGFAGAYLLLRRLRGSSAADLAAEAFLMLTTGVIGYLTESWGTTHGHWTYAHLPPGHTVPVWVPVAWSLGALLLNRLDDRLHAAGASTPRRLLLGGASGVVYPLLGESICIALGVWTYHWPWQILGVPLLALLLIAYAHLTFALMRSGLLFALRPPQR